MVSGLFLSGSPSPTWGCCSASRSIGERSRSTRRARGCGPTSIRSRSACTARPGRSSAPWAPPCATAGPTCRSTSARRWCSSSATPFLVRLVSVARAHNITSIADFVSSRFGKSPALAALVTVIALTAAVPYLSLQYKAVGTSIDVLTGSAAAHPAWYADPALWVALLMALFAVLFGTRQLDATEHHEGVMLAIAFESRREAARVRRGRRVRAAAPRRRAAARRHPPRRPAATSRARRSQPRPCSPPPRSSACRASSWSAWSSAPTQPTCARRAGCFPAYLAVFSVFVVPVVLAGLGAGLGERHHARLLRADPADGARRDGLAILVFLGGLSAATAMVIMASIALATMITNDLVMPALWRSRWLGIGHGRRRRPPRAVAAARGDRAAGAAGLRLPPRHRTRRRASPRSGCWPSPPSRSSRRRSSRACTGAAPRAKACSAGLAAATSCGSTRCCCRPSAPAPSIGLPLLAGAALAVGANVFAMVVVSRLRGVSLRDRMTATAFLRGALPAPGVADAGGARVGDLLAVTERILGADTAQRALQEYCRQAGRPIAATGGAGRPRPAAVHGARARRRDRRVVGAAHVHACAARPRHRGRGSRRTARRDLAGTALQPPAAAGHDGERVAGHRRGRRRGAHRRVEPPLPRDVRVPGRHGVRRAGPSPT